MNIRMPAPTAVQDNLPLPPKMPRLPGEVFARFPQLQRWQEQTDTWYRRLADAIQQGNRTVSQSIGDPSIVKALRGTIGNFTFETRSITIGEGIYYISINSGGDVTNPDGASVQVGQNPDSNIVIMEVSPDSGLTGLSLFNRAGQRIGYVAVLDSDDSVQAFFGGGAGAATQAVTINGNASEIAFGSSEDVNLYRSGANTLRTDDNLVVNLDLTVNGAATVTGLLTASNDFTLADDMTLASGSVLTWASDTNLYRDSANVLRTDDTMRAANVFVTAGGFLRLGNAAVLTADTPIIGYVQLVDSNGNVVNVGIV